ncbi:arylesterase [Daejeonella sp.]|jgi:acyl-CoA thioesterase-1|uniref:arylesterase n=1 Tax=Daejeonella sp. TaxID=2805397 RepID=UPI0037833D73
MNKLKNYISLFLLSTLCACGSGGNNKTKIDGVEKTKEKSVGTKKNILVFGDSLTAGLGVEQEEAFPDILGNKIDSLQLPYEVINAGLSGETSAAGKARIDWLLKDNVAIFILELGANDGLRGIPVSETRKNLQSIIDQVKAKYPEAKLVIVGMEVPPNMGKTYASDFRMIFPDLAKKNNMALVPFLLDRVGGIPELNQADGIHPTAAGHQILADNVWKVLKDIL